MPDRRRHRGAHPEDARLFAPDQLPALQRATAELSWLLGRGYREVGALKLVGDRHQLNRRQRIAVQRSACAPAAARARRAALRPVEGATVALDGFNQLITVEAALAGGVLLRGADGRVRDLSSVHGSYRRVDESEAAVDLLARALLPAAEVVAVLDRPVSNSGRVAAMFRDRGWQAELADQADARLLELADSGYLLASADGPLLDRALARGATLADPVARLLDDPIFVQLSDRSVLPLDHWPAGDEA